jgi:hypothetical protein
LIVLKPFVFQSTRRAVHGRRAVPVDDGNIRND